MYSLVGVNGNAYALMGYTQRAMRENGFEKTDVDKMLKDAMSSDYNNLIRVCDSYIQKINEKLGLSEDGDYDDEDDDYI